MIVDKSVLENALEKAMSSIYSNKKVVEKFCDNMMVNHNVKTGKSMSYIGLNVDLRLESKEHLLWVTKELEDAVKVDENTSYLKNNLKLDKYFTDLEIKNLSKTKLMEDTESSKFPIVIDKVISVNNDQWVTAKGVEFVKELRDKQIIRYNPSTQREQTVKKTMSGVRYIITIILKAVKQIMELMKKGKFISNAITFNINADEESDFDYDEETMTLTIYSGTIDIIDGNHRYISMTNCKDDNPDFNYNTIINIMHFSEDKAKRFIVQENKRNVISKNKIRSLDVDNAGSSIVDNLNENSKSHLKGLIGTTKGCSIKFSLLADLMDFNFPASTPQEIIKIKKYTVKAFNALIEDNISLIEEKQPDLKWVFYVRVMKEFYDTEDMDMFIKKVNKINSLDFSKIDIKVNTVGKTLYKKVDPIIQQI